MKPKASTFIFNQIIKPHLKRMLIIHTHNMPAAQPIFTRRLSRKLENAVINASFDLSIPRTVMLAKVCRSESGVEYIQGDEFETAACVPKQVGDQLTEALEQITHNKRHYIGDAYIVANGLVNIPDDLAEKLFRQFGAFNALAKWELDNAK